MRTSQAKSKLRKVEIFQIILLLFTLSAFLIILIIAMIPIESYPARGTFKYSIHALPVWYDETSLHPSTLKLFYGSRFEIVEKELADANLKFLKVTSTNSGVNSLTITASSHAEPNRRYVIYYSYFHGPKVPHPPVDGGVVIDVNDLILELNVTNGEITIKLAVLLGSIRVYVPELERHGTYLSNDANHSISVTTITVENGNPTQVKSGNVTSTTTADLGFSEWSVERALSLYNPNIIQIKEMIPVLSTVGIASAIISAIVIYTRAKK